MAEGNGLENRRRETVPEFESLLLRHFYSKINKLDEYFGFVMHKVLHKKLVKTGFFCI